MMIKSNYHGADAIGLISNITIKNPLCKFAYSRLILLDPCVRSEILFSMPVSLFSPL